MLSFIFLGTIFGAYGMELPDNCSPNQFFDPATFTCLSCPTNNSMVRSSDGFGCACNEHSVPSSFNSCRPCNSTQVVSADGTSCVPRKCQSTLGKLVCRKCPIDFISVTQNLDGSPTKEVLCIKCAKGYKAHDNTCVRCESCTCTRSQVVVKGICIPKVYVNSRPKYEEKLLHPLELLDTVKQEYLCAQNDFRACRALSNLCVKNFYSSDLGGPCRLWVQPKLSTPKGLPPLIIVPSASDTNPGEMIVPRHGQISVFLALAVYTYSGGMRFIQNIQQRPNQCQLPINVKIGELISYDCPMNLKSLDSESNETFTPFLFVDGEYRPLPVSLTKPSGYNVQRGTWMSSKFRRYFTVNNEISTTSNITNTIYLRNLLIRIRLERIKHVNGSLRITTTMEAQYAVKPTYEHTVMTTLTVEHDMPNAGVIRGLEIWGGVLGAFLALFALAQWRGILSRGGLHFTVLPLLAGSTADTLYFSALLSTLHALAAEAGTLGMTLPLSRSEERMIKAFLYSAVGLKAVKVAWINWKQCTCDIFFLDWSEYNPPVKESLVENKRWKITILAREWSLMQAVRRASPGFTVPLALLILHLLSSWKSLLPQNDGYKWAVVSIAWWSSYGVVLVTSWLKERLMYSHVSTLPSICTGVGVSLMVFQEELYAHYVHGRNDDCKEVRSIAGPLATCRVACVPQLRRITLKNARNQAVSLLPILLRLVAWNWHLDSPSFKTFQSILRESEGRKELLSRFLAAFFERALDGLNWVASERTIFERLLDVELTSRAAGNTSALLYDDDTVPSCLAMTWWGEEWNLSTFDAMLFSSVFIASDDILLAALLTIIVWQIMKQLRTLFGNKNQTEKTGIEVYFI